MELGEKLRHARLAAGLSQRQLCGEVITRNMLSQIENGAARPSMDTLRYLAGRLGKSVSFFLEEDAVASPNCAAMAQARAALRSADAAALKTALEAYRAPDDVFDEEWKLLTVHGCILEAEEAIASGRERYAMELLTRAEEVGKGTAYYTAELSRSVLLLQGRLRAAEPGAVCAKLPSMDEELLLRARAALKDEDDVRCLYLLESAEDRTAPMWNFLRGELYLRERAYDSAALCFLKAEETLGQTVFPKLEQCYRELGDFKQAYAYACKQKVR